MYLNSRWYLLLFTCIVLLIISFFFSWLFQGVLVFTILFFVFSFIDYILLFFLKGGVTATRNVATRLSIGYDNEVILTITNTYPFNVKALLIDELPFQFQVRNFELKMSIGFRSSKSISYFLKPLSRGEFNFGYLLCYTISPLGLLQKRIKIAEPVMVKVYPAFQQLRKYQLIATSDNSVPGVKKIRKLGNSLEFEKIKDYVPGDDVRTINWKATARSSNLMVNTFTDAKQQQIYCLVDKGRSMKMPFEGLTLLDHSINACLALLNVALLKQDKAGLITFSNKVNDIIAADRRLIPDTIDFKIIKPRNSSFYLPGGKLKYCVIINRKEEDKFELSDIK